MRYCELWVKVLAFNASLNEDIFHTGSVRFRKMMISVCEWLGNFVENQKPGYKNYCVFPLYVLIVLTTYTSTFAIHYATSLPPFRLSSEKKDSFLSEIKTFFLEEIKTFFLITKTSTEFSRSPYAAN